MWSSSSSFTQITPSQKEIYRPISFLSTQKLSPPLSLLVAKRQTHFCLGTTSGSTWALRPVSEDKDSMSTSSHVHFQVFGFF